MIIQVFGKKSCNNTKKAERFFKERNVKIQFIDLNKYPISKGELKVITNVFPIEELLDTEGNEKTGGEEESWNLCGALCTVSDVVVKRFPLHKPQLHDILVFERVGAYSVTEGIYLFLSRPLPRIYFWTEGEGLRMVRDGVHTDLLNSEK